MKRNIRKMLIYTLLVVMVLLSFSCKKKVKHKWIEVGSDPNPAPIAPGVHPERGSASDAVKIVLATIYRPLGRDKDGIPQYKKYLFELEELTPDILNQAFIEVQLIDESSLFCDLLIEDSEEVLNAGPGATDAQLTKKGTARYVDLSSVLDNSDEYEGKYYAKDLVGLIDQSDIEYCITKSFEENFQLVSCDITPVDMDVYNQVHKK